MESFHLPWPKALLLVLLNLRSTPFGKHRLSPFEIITGRPLRLDQGLYEPAPLKGDVLIYCKELIRALKTHSQLVEQPFHSALLERKIYNVAISDLEILFIINAISIKMPFCPSGKGHIRYC